jgi:hypothetical protein
LPSSFASGAGDGHARATLHATSPPKSSEIAAGKKSPQRLVGARNRVPSWQ